MAFDRHQAIQYAYGTEFVVSAYVNKFGELTQEEIEEFGELPEEDEVVEGEVIQDEQETEEIRLNSEDERLDSPPEAEESGAVPESDEQR